HAAARPGRPLAGRHDRARLRDPVPGRGREPVDRLRRRAGDAVRDGHPLRARALLFASGAARATPFAIAIRSVQREAIRSDPEWKGGAYDPAAGPVTGLRPARQLGLIPYPSR